MKLLISTLQAVNMLVSCVMCVEVGTLVECGGLVCDVLRQTCAVSVIMEENIPLIMNF